MGWKVTEIATADVPPRRSKWGGFCREMLLRLERTTTSRTLAVEFDTEREAVCAQEALRRNLRGKARTRVVGRVLYVTPRPLAKKTKVDKSN